MEEEQQVQETPEETAETTEESRSTQQETQERESYTPEEVKALRKEAADYRIKLRKLEKQSEADAQQKEQERRAKMEETERLKLEKQEAEERAEQSLSRANERLVNSEARTLAASRGVSGERLAYVVRLADLSSVEVDDEGNADDAAVSSAVEKVLADIPELVSATPTQENERQRRAPDMSTRDRQRSPDEAVERFNAQLRGMVGSST